LEPILKYRLGCPLSMGSKGNDEFPLVGVPEGGVAPLKN
jgi:hypothetical protein